MTLTVGQKLWYVPRNPPRPGRGVAVLSVGRKWATLANHTRINIQTLEADWGIYTSPGQAYLTREDHEREIEDQRTWEALCRVVRYGNPPCDAQKIRQAAALLGLELDVVGRDT